MKKIFVLIYCFLISFSSFAFFDKNIDEKLLRSFREAFPNAQQVNWSELSESYIVYFMENGVRARITYGKGGDFVEAFRYYGEQQLPPSILFNIRKRFPGKRVFGVTEFSTSSSVDYYVKMVDAKHWLTIKMDSGGNWEWVEKYTKAPQD
jgi:hypothetical protein